MKQLILKDFKLLNYINLFTIFICFVGGYMGISTENNIKSKLVYVFTVLIISYLSSIILSQKEIKTKSDIIINSLPTTRSDVVVAKYLFSIIYVLLASILVFFSSYLLSIIIPSITPGPRTSIYNTLATVGIALLFYSIYLLIYYINIGRAQVFNQVFYIILVLSPLVIGRFSEKIASLTIFKYLLNINFNIMIYLLIIFAIIFYIISLNFSIKVYKAKEF